MSGAGFLRRDHVAGEHQANRAARSGADDVLEHRPHRRLRRGRRDRQRPARVERLRDDPGHARPGGQAPAATISV